MKELPLKQYEVPINKHLAWSITENSEGKKFRELTFNRGEMVRAYKLFRAKGKVELPFSFSFTTPTFWSDSIQAPELWYYALPEKVKDYQAYYDELQKLDMWKFDEDVATRIQNKHTQDIKAKDITNKVDAEDIETGEEDL